MPYACRLHAFGSHPPALRVEFLPAREPAPGEVVLGMLAAPVNPADLNVIEGTYGELPELPATIGNEGCGEILKIGADVQGWNVGDLALPLQQGTWASEMRLPAGALIPLPRGVDPLQAAMLGVNPATAWRMLHDFTTLREGDWIVQNAANSGVGRAVIQLARALGLRTLNVVRRAELIDELLGIGADVVVAEETDLRTHADSLCGSVRPKLGLNAVGGASALNIANALAPDATLVTYGAMSRQPLKIPNGLLIFKNLAIRGFWLRRWRESATAAEVRSTYESLAGFLAKGGLHTPVHSVHPLGDVLEAVAEAALERRGGKVLLQLDSCGAQDPGARNDTSGQ